MAHAAEIANSNHRSAQDMVDYSLDRQTVHLPADRQLWKVSNEVTPGASRSARRRHALVDVTVILSINAS